MENFDDKFAGVPNLKWYPWMGDDFSVIEKDKRVLFIGESHYHGKNVDTLERSLNPELTREIVEDFGVWRNYNGSKIFKNLHKALFGNDEFRSGKFWHLTSFYNFIQRPMNNPNDRPTRSDFQKSWPVFLDVIKIIKPTICVFIGTTAANHLSAISTNEEFKIDGPNWGELIGTTYAKTASISNPVVGSVDCVFIKHTSQYFSWQKWNTYLKATIPNQLEFFESQII